MAEAAIAVSSATLPVVVRPGDVQSARRPVVPLRVRCRVDALPGEGTAAPAGDAGATDHTDFSMVGVAG